MHSCADFCMPILSSINNNWGAYLKHIALFQFHSVDTSFTFTQTLKTLTSECKSNAWSNCISISPAPGLTYYFQAILKSSEKSSSLERFRMKFIVYQFRWKCDAAEHPFDRFQSPQSPWQGVCSNGRVWTMCSPCHYCTFQVSVNLN